MLVTIDGLLIDVVDGSLLMVVDISSEDVPVVCEALLDSTAPDGEVFTDVVAISFLLLENLWVLIGLLVVAFGSMEFIADVEMILPVSTSEIASVVDWVSLLIVLVEVNSEEDALLVWLR